MMKNFYILFVFMILSLMNNLQAQTPALNFDGANDYIQTTYAGIPGSADRTIEAWIRTTGNFIPGGGGGVQGVIVDYGTFSTGQRFTFNVLWSNAIRLEVGGNGVSGSIAVNDGVWHHVAVVYTSVGNLVKLYVDGVLDTQGSPTITANTGSTNNVMIGRRVDNVNYFPGNIDEVRFYNYAKTQAEIVADMNAEFCALPTGLVGYWKLNEGTPNGSNAGQTTATDYSGNGNNGTLHGFALTGMFSNWVGGNVAGNSNTSSTITAAGCLEYKSPSGNHTWTSSGTYMDTIPNAGGCDSIITINLTIGTGSTSSTVSAAGCLSYTSPSGNHIWTSSGTYIDTIPNSGGCDSIMTINLTINTTNTSNVITVYECSSYTSPSGNYTWTSTGSYNDTIPNSVGCDSVITIDLTIGSVFIESIVTGCDSVYVNEQWFFASQAIVYTVSNPSGCDTIQSVDMVVTSIDTSITNNNGTLTANQANADNYTWIDCATQMPIPGATSSSFTPTQDGNYAVIIDIDGCSSSSSCIPVTILSTLNIKLSEALQIIPNPNNGQFIIELKEVGTASSYTIYDVYGREVANKIIQGSDRFTVRENLSSGIYFIIVEMKKGRLLQKVMVD